MKREGRQHGMVRTYRVLPALLNPRPETRHVNKFESIPMAELFTRVSTRPNNHSKYTSKCTKPKCTECRIHPASKSKDKAKGHQKLKSGDLVTNHKLVTWRVVDRHLGLNFSGLSATAILDTLSSGHYDYDTHHGEDDNIDDDENESSANIEDEMGFCMGFCNVDDEFDYQIEEDEGWCLVPQT